MVHVRRRTTPSVVQILSMVKGIYLLGLWLLLESFFHGHHAPRMLFKIKLGLPYSIPASSFSSYP